MDRFQNSKHTKSPQTLCCSLTVSCQIFGCVHWQGPKMPVLVLSCKYPRRMVFTVALYDIVPPLPLFLSSFVFFFFAFTYLFIAHLVIAAVFLPLLCHLSTEFQLHPCHLWSIETIYSIVDMSVITPSSVLFREMAKGDCMWWRSI